MAAPTRVSASRRMPRSPSNARVPNTPSVTGPIATLPCPDVIQLPALDRQEHDLSATASTQVLTLRSAYNPGHPQMLPITASRTRRAQPPDGIDGHPCGL